MLLRILTRWVFLMMTLVEPLIISAKVFHIAMPAVSQTTNGTFPFGADLKPTLKTTQRMNIITRGFMKVQKKPNREPTYCWVILRFAISAIRYRRWNNVRIKSIDPRRRKMSLLIMRRYLRKTVNRE